ncbi:phosphatase PAP2 family protein [Candidatus Methylocalor cossyra]|uniref:Phosphoesterase PA-phosphatase n=1 Tax=Candidatus Methylocalor cossyra TaxID=3108543 RepID=A0ABP1C8B0_9GAMM
MLLISFLRRHWDWLGCALLALAFIGHGELDLAFSGLFYRPGDGFFLSGTPEVRLVHELVPALAVVLPSLLLALWLLGFFPRCGRLRRHQPALLYLLLCFALGPGLLVNTLFKSHWGRARPAEVVQFGGDKVFTPPFVISDQCQRNCSFVCGHASAGFALCALGFLTRRRLWFGVAGALGGLWGLARVAHGKHFLSDVVFSFFAVYFCAKLLHFAMFHPLSPLQRRAGLNPGDRPAARFPTLDKSLP